jgi:hypothetical protein
MIGRGNRSTRRKPAPVPLCPPQTPHAARTRTRASVVGSQRLTAELRHGLVCTIYILHVIKRMYICINVCIYNIYKGLCQFRLSTTNHTLLLIAPATTAVYSLERSYAWQPPSLSLLYFWPHSDLNDLLYSVYVSKEMFVDHSYPWKCVLQRVSFQESISMETCLLTRFLATGLHVTVA